MPKLMFLGVVGRPCWDFSQNQLFNGKVGMFPLAREVAAKRTSVNRVAGTIEWKPIPKITKVIYEEFMLEKVLPAILSKWPRVRHKLWIQQDNASAHISRERFDYLWNRHKDHLHDLYSPRFCFEIGLYCQPPNSPDLNVLNLGVFNALQSIQ